MAVELNNTDIQAQRLKEIIRYRKDPIAFLKEQCKIKHPRRGIIPFELFPAQEDCIKNFINHRFNIVLKSRQLGITTIVAGYCTWRMVFFPHQEIRVVATKNETAQISIEMANTMVDNIEPWILSMLGAIRATERKHTVELLNGSRMSAFGQARGSNPDTGVGRSLSLLVVDEAALIPNMTDIWTSIYPTLSQGGNSCDENTIIFTDKGLYRISDLNPTQNLSEGFYDLKNINVINKNNKPENALSYHISKPILGNKIYFDNGNFIIVSDEHPLLCNFDNEEFWKESKDIKIGDTIVGQYNQNVFGSLIKYPEFKNYHNIRKNYEMNNIDFSYLCGLFVAKGNLIKKNTKPYAINITNGDVDIQNWLRNNKFKKIDDRHFRLTNSYATEKLIFLGCKEYSKNKTVPNKILSSTKEEQISFLQGLFDGDGCSSGNMIKYDSASEQLVIDVHTMLLNFGIISSIKKITQKPTKLVKKYNGTGYELRIYGENTRKFYEIIGFRLQRKQLNYNKIKDNKNFSLYNISDKNNFKTMAQKSGYVLYHSKNNNNKKYLRDYINIERYLYTKNDNISKHCANVILDIYDKDLEEHKIFKEEVSKQENNTKLYLKVSHIERTKIEKPMYDFIVPNTHSFVGNGIINHNCIVLSTPRGTSNWFYDTFRKAEDKDYKEGEIPFHPIKLMWWENTERMNTPLEPDESIPGGYTNQWARATFANLTLKQIAQEYCVSENTMVTIRNKENNNIETISIKELKERLKNE
jgi:intein/homing endonuclease